jgi:hypothetical protein
LKRNISMIRRFHLHPNPPPSRVRVRVCPAIMD